MSLVPALNSGSKCAREIEDGNKPLLLYSFWGLGWFMTISFYVSWREVLKNLPGFLMVFSLCSWCWNFFLFFTVACVVWTVWVWQSNGTCLREIPAFILKQARNGLDCFFKGLTTLLFFSFIQLFAPWERSILHAAVPARLCNLQGNGSAVPSGLGPVLLLSVPAGHETSLV